MQFDLHDHANRKEAINQSGSDLSREENENSEDFEEEEIPDIVLEEQKPNCFQRMDQRLSNMMIDPHSNRSKLIQAAVSITFFLDIFITSLLIGNYQFQIGKDASFLNHSDVYTYITIIYGLEILMNFFRA